MDHLKPSDVNNVFVFTTIVRVTQQKGFSKLLFDNETVGLMNDEGPH